MFFIMGISSGEKKLNYVKTVICSNCSMFGRYEIFMTYTYLSLFFIPILKWGRHFYVKTTCCGKLYELNPIVGKMILKGQDTDIRSEDLTAAPGHSGFHRNCPECGYSVNSEYKYCPKCGKHM
jgi:hypothetical protein